MIFLWIICYRKRKKVWYKKEKRNGGTFYGKASNKEKGSKSSWIWKVDGLEKLRHITGMGKHADVEFFVNLCQ